MINYNFKLIFKHNKIKFQIYSKIKQKSNFKNINQKNHKFMVILIYNLLEIIYYYK